MVPYKPQKVEKFHLVGSVLVHPAKDLLLNMRSLNLITPSKMVYLYKIAAYIWRSYLLSLVTYQTQVNRINLGKWKPVPGFLYVGVVKESILAFSCHRQSCWVWRHVCNMHAHTHAFFLTRNPPYNVQTMIANMS